MFTGPTSPTGARYQVLFQVWGPKPKQCSLMSLACHPPDSQLPQARKTKASKEIKQPDSSQIRVCMEAKDERNVLAQVHKPKRASATWKHTDTHETLPTGPPVSNTAGTNGDSRGCHCRSCTPAPIPSLAPSPFLLPPPPEHLHHLLELPNISQIAPKLTLSPQHRSLCL